MSDRSCLAGNPVPTSVLFPTLVCPLLFGHTPSLMVVVTRDRQGCVVKENDKTKSG